MSNQELFIKVKDECSNVVYGVLHDKEYPVITESYDETKGTIYNIVNESNELIGINHEYVNTIWRDR